MLAVTAAESAEGL